MCWWVLLGVLRGGGGVHKGSMSVPPGVGSDLGFQGGNCLHRSSADVGGNELGHESAAHGCCCGAVDAADQDIDVQRVLTTTSEVGNVPQAPGGSASPSATPLHYGARNYPPPDAPPPPCVTFRRVVAPLRGPGQSPVLPFACCVGSLRSVGRCGRCSRWCRFRVRGAQSLVCWGCAGCGGVCRLRVSGAQ